jgi:O-succinylbenzoate synthase
MKSFIQKHTLQFKFEAGTSRGVLKTKDTWFIKVWDDRNPEIVGVGEAGPLKGLSPDDCPGFENKLHELTEKLNDFDLVELVEIDLKSVFDLDAFPSLLFALETALLDLKNGGRKQIFVNDFFAGKKSIPINGLVWMGDKQFMTEQIEQKLAEGYTCLKMKIGAIDFETECAILETIRQRFSAREITLRVDVNGAFSERDVWSKLERLKQYELHSIEQPIKSHQVALMKDLCEKSPIPVALDEELIGVIHFNDKQNLLKTLRPPFIILKPTLLGGFKATDEWISIASSLGIQWWITSALESNIGLNAIAQYTAQKDVNNFPQGLGTGRLYSNNIVSPLVINEGRLHYRSQTSWSQ